MTTFRISAHSLRIETGRYERKPNKENKLIKKTSHKHIQKTERRWGIQSANFKVKIIKF